MLLLPLSETRQENTLGHKRPAAALIAAVLLVAAGGGGALTAAGPAGAALAKKQCAFGFVPTSGELTYTNQFGDGSTVTVKNTGLTGLGVVGSIDIGGKTNRFTLLPTGSKTYELPPPGQLVSQLPMTNGFTIHIDSDAHLVSFKVDSTMCAADEYIWNGGVGVDSQMRSSATEPKTGVAQASVYVRMGRPVKHRVTMDYSTVGGTATAGRDFTPVKGVLTVNPGEQMKWLTVPILADALTEGPESFTLRLDANSTPANQNTTLVVNPRVDINVTITDTPRAATPAPANVKPVAAFTWARKAGAGNVVAFNGTRSSDRDGRITGYRWVLNGAVLSTAAAPTLSLGAGTSKTVSLTVTDDRGATATTSQKLSLANRPPRILTVAPAPGATVGSITPTLSASGADDDGDQLSYSYRVTGPSVDVSSGWVGGAWTVPPHRLDPGTTYQLVASVKDPAGASASRTTSFRVMPLPTAGDVVATSTGNGYWQVASDGGVFSYGDAQFYGSVPGLGLHLTNIMGMARTPTNGGYWLVGTDGGVFAFGDAVFAGSLPGLRIAVNNIVGMAPTRTGKGYWLVGSDGGVFAFGDAGFHGSMGGKPLNKPVVAMSPTLSGNGYWLAAQDGGIFAFGDAGFYGSMGGKPLNAPVTDMDAAPDGRGYWMAAEDGGVFAFGSAAFFGSMAGKPLNGHITGMAATANGKGYWLNGCDGGVFAFGNAAFRGSNATYQCRGA
jgi:hypothetical protein